MFAGAQVSLYPMTDGFVDVILSSLSALDPYRERLRIETDDISTLIVGPPEVLFPALLFAVPFFVVAGPGAALFQFFALGDFVQANALATFLLDGEGNLVGLGGFLLETLSIVAFLFVIDPPTFIGQVPPTSGQLNIVINIVGVMHRG